MVSSHPLYLAMKHKFEMSTAKRLPRKFLEDFYFLSFFIVTAKTFLNGFLRGFCSKYLCASSHLELSS